MNVWKLIVTAVTVFLLVVFGPRLLAWLGLLGQLQPYSFWILLLTAITMEFKLLLEGLIVDEFQLHKFGYDLAILAMGTALSGFSVQLVSTQDLFPGCPSTGVWYVLNALTPNIITQRLIVLSLFFFFSFIMALISGAIRKEIAKPGTKWKDPLGAVGTLCGSLPLAMYIQMLVTKGG